MSTPTADIAALPASTEVAEFERLIVETAPGYLRCEAKVPPLKPLLWIGGIAGVVLIALLAVATMSVVQDVRSNSRDAGFKTFVLGVTAAVVGSAVALFVVIVRRSRRPRRLTIESNQLVLLTPDQPIVEHRVDCADIKGVTLRGGDATSLRRTASTLVIQRRRGLPIRGFAGLPTNDLVHVVDAVNRFVRIERYKAFEVVVGEGAADVPMASLAGDPGEPILPQIVRPVDAPSRDLPVDHWQQ